MAKRVNNYTFGIFCATFIGLLFGIILLFFCHFTTGIIPRWLFDLLFPFLLTSQLASCIGYNQRFIDLITNETTIFDICLNALKRLFLLETYTKQLERLSQKNTFETLGLFLGIIAGIALTILQLALHITLPGAAIFSDAFCRLIMLISNISSLAGFLNRCGRVIDYSRKNLHDLPSIKEAIKTFFTQDDINYTLGIIGGVLGGIILSTVFLAVIGSSLASMGGAIPVWAGCALFFVSIVGSTASASGYIGRCFDALLGKRTLFTAIYTHEKIAPKINAETVLTSAGSVFGICLAIGLMAAGITTLPVFGAGAPPLVAGFGLFLLCISASAGLGNRLGNGFDRLMHPKLSESIEPADPFLEKKENNRSSEKNTSPTDQHVLPSETSSEKNTSLTDQLVLPSETPSEKNTSLTDQCVKETVDKRNIYNDSLQKFTLFQENDKKKIGNETPVNVEKPAMHLI